MFIATHKLHFLSLYIEARSVLCKVYCTIGIFQQVFPTAFQPVATGVFLNQYKPKTRSSAEDYNKCSKPHALDIIILSSLV